MGYLRVASQRCGEDTQHPRRVRGHRDAVQGGRHDKSDPVLLGEPGAVGAQAGSAYVSPFVGRLDDVGHQGMEVVEDIVDVYEMHDISTQVLAASIRHPLHCVMAAKAGAHVATVTFQVLGQMVRHPLTDQGLSRFTSDWAEAGKP